MNITKKNITGILLAGGLGTRMGHVDKGLQPVGDTTLAEAVIHRLKPQVGALMINANRNLDIYQQFGFAVWPDEITGNVGPLAGIHAGLTHCDTDYLLTVPCDTPDFPEDLVERLTFGMKLAVADLAFAVTGAIAAPDAHPVFCLLKRELLPSLEAYLRNGGRKLITWMHEQNHTQVHFTDSLAFVNINTPDDLQAFMSSRHPGA